MKTEESEARGRLLIVTFLVVLIIIAVIRNFTLDRTNQVVSVGAVFIGPCDDHGWNESNYTGLKAACDELSCKLIIRESVLENETAVRAAVKELVDQACDVVFLTSFGYGEYSQPVAASWPDKAFFCMSENGESPNWTTYFARLYQARYLSGIVAGSESESGVLGYVAGIPNAQTIRGINAYALGARYVNPDARVLVYYTDSWDDEEKEKACAEKLTAAGADVITCHEERDHAIEKAEELGVYTIGYGDVYGTYSERFLTSVLYEWEVIYRCALGDYLSGRSNLSRGYWYGLEDDAVSLYTYSPLVSDTVRGLVAAEKERMQTMGDVFAGEIRDNSGVLRCGTDERISDHELFYDMDWYVEGVEIRNE